jgi:hypothetical protein
MPSISIKLVKSALKNWLNACRKNLPFFPKCAINSSRLAVLVRLQRFMPVMHNFFPGTSIFSSNSVFKPRVAACPAAIKPAGPPPTTITSKKAFASIF